MDIANHNKQSILQQFKTFFPNLWANNQLLHFANVITFHTLRKTINSPIIWIGIVKNIICVKQYNKSFVKISNINCLSAYFFILLRYKKLHTDVQSKKHSFLFVDEKCLNSVHTVRVCKTQTKLINLRF